jgi:lauroyl/myristoyl acyltransferase
MLRYLGFLWGAWLAQRLPLRVAYALAWLAAEVFFLCNLPARRVAVGHMRQILGPHAPAAVVRRAARGCFHATAYYYADLARTPRIDPIVFNARNIHDTGYEHIERALAAGRGAVLASIHYGNPERVSQCLIARGLTYLALVEPLRPPALAALFQRLRSSLGHEYVEADLSGIKRALRHLRRGGVVAILVDRDIQHTGLEVEFLGAPARLPPGAIDLAMRTGAPVLPVITRRLRLDEFEAIIEPPVELVRTGNVQADRRENVARLARRFEPYLRRDPSQWFVIDEPVWLQLPAKVPSGQADHSRTR